MCNSNQRPCVARLLRSGGESAVRRWSGAIDGPRTRCCLSGDANGCSRSGRALQGHT